jgi:osmotically-inducible protein OsmY
MNLKQPIDRVGGLVRSTARRTSRFGRGAASFVTGKARAVTTRSTPKPDMDDQTLKNKVETEIFRAEDAPKGSVNVSVVAGVVELRGEVKRPEIKKAIEAKARRIPEVRDVRNLLHLPKTPAPGRADSPGRLRRKSPTG